MKLRNIFYLILTACSPFTSFSQQQLGADIPWITYEAENMRTDAKVIGPLYTPYHVETESSGQKCVQLTGNDQYVEFTAGTASNTMVIRYSLPDDEKGNGTRSRLGIYKNGKLIGSYNISSRHSRLYGTYPFTNNPAAGKPRNFYDEIRIKDLHISKNDVIRIQLEAANNDAKTCILDLVDLENIAPPLTMPENAISLSDKRFGTDSDYTGALRQCIALAAKTGKTVWMPPGNYQITGDILVPAGVTIQGAGMWYTTLTGDSADYIHEDKRIRIIGKGSNIHLSDFAIIGSLNYRSDKEANDGITGCYGSHSSVTRIWLEHTKVGMWIENSSHLMVQGCRIRNTMADGINFCVGMNNSVIKNCTARGTGDDCFAIWPTTFKQQQFHPENILIINCTAQLPFLANGAAIYGGQSNEVKNCSFIDISAGSAILISTTFPTENKDVHNNFSGKTRVENCTIGTSGGFDHEWGWRAAVEICLDKRSIRGLCLQKLTIKNSFSNAISVVARNAPDTAGSLLDASMSEIKVSNYGTGVKNGYALYISDCAHGNLRFNRSEIHNIENQSKNFTLMHP